MRVIYPRLPGPGWDAITVLARVCASVLGAQLIEYSVTSRGNALRSPLAMLPRRSRGSDHCLLIAARPEYLHQILRTQHLLRGAAHTSAWVIDSFWTNRIPAGIGRHGHLDHVFITDGELTSVWNRRLGVPTTWLPIGSDVLDRGSPGGPRPVDVQRIGRQPAPWDDDAENAQQAAAAGLTYRGRPRFNPDPLTNMAILHEAMSRAKFTLSFSNRVNQESYTHPDREYLTPRWTDALACGAVVAGAAPRTRTAELLWPGATLEVSSTDRDHGIELISDAVGDWAPERAQINYTNALSRFDLRLRMQSLADEIGYASTTLTSELARLRRMIEDVDMHSR